MSSMEVVQADLDNPIEVLSAWVGSPIDETTLGCILGASTEIGTTQLGLGRTTQNLSDLHGLVRTQCSERFSELRDADPEKSKEAINEDPHLMALNSVRRVLHQAMVRRQKQATRLRRTKFI